MLEVEEKVCEGERYEGEVRELKEVEEEEERQEGRKRDEISEEIQLQSTPRGTWNMYNVYQEHMLLYIYNYITV